MENKNKPNYQLAGIKRNNLLNYKKNSKCYDLVVCKLSKHNKRFVIEKIGSYDGKNYIINYHRLIYWMQFNLSVNIKGWKILFENIKIISKFF